MKKASIEKIVELAEKWQAEGKAWHFHMLTPGCMFNDISDKHAFVLENCSDKETYVTYSDERYMQQGKHLVKLLHGENITTSDQSSAKSPSSTVQEIVKRAESLNSKGLTWHHHMLFPNCIFNKQAGKWNIVFEDSESGELLEATYDSEPKSDLSSVEELYYAQKK